MTNPNIYRNQEEKDKAVKFEIKDTRQQIKITEDYLIRLKKKLDDLLSGKIDNP